MYVVFWNQLIKVFVLREAKSAEAYDPPNDGSEAWTVIDDSVCGRLDAFALIARYADESGWRQYCIEVS